MFVMEFVHAINNEVKGNGLFICFCNLNGNICMLTLLNRLRLVAQYRNPLVIYARIYLERGKMRFLLRSSCTIIN